MPETPVQTVYRVFREHKRYSGDNLPNEPVGAPLPVGDPESGPWNPKKADLREALLAPLSELDAQVQNAADQVGYAEEWAQSEDPISVDAGGDGATDRSSKWHADRAETIATNFGDLETAVGDAEAAATAAAGYVNDIVAEKEVPITGTRVGMEALEFPAGMNAVRTSGFATMGDGRGAIYIRVATEPAHGGKVRSVDRILPNGTTDATHGGWWEVSTYDLADVRLYGATGDGTTDDSAAIIAVEALGRCLVFPAGTYRLSDDVTFSVPVQFEFGAKLSIDDTYTATFEGSVHSGPQVIFDGAGSIDGTFGGVFVFEQWFSGTVTNASDVLPRLYQTTGPTTITVGVDTATVQEALNLIPLYVSHRFTITVPSGVDTYEIEDLIVPFHKQSFANVQMASPSVDGGLVIIQSDDLVTPAYYKVGSIVGAGGSGTVSLRYIWTTKSSPYSDGSAIEARYGINFTVNAHKGDMSNNGGVQIDRAYCAYYDGKIDIRAPIDLGTDQFIHAFVPKRNGRIYVNGYDDDVSDVNMVGTVDYISWNQGGDLQYPRNHQGSGSALAYNIAAAKGGQMAISYDRANTIYPSARFEGAEVTQPFCWSKHTRTTENIAAGGTLNIATIPYYLPPRTALCVRRIASKFSQGTLRVRIQKSGGTKWTAPRDDHSLLDPADAANVLIEDNNSTTVPVSGGLAFVIIENVGGASVSLSLNDYIYVEFTYTSPNSNEFTPLA